MTEPTAEELRALERKTSDALTGFATRSPARHDGLRWPRTFVWAH
jgi:hypothetical protein